MGLHAGAAINEGVALLENLSPRRMSQLRVEFPALSDRLVDGIDAGLPDDASAEDALIQEKASIMIAVLNEAGNAAETASSSVARSVKSARRQRLASQILVLIGSSSSLATLALSKNRAAVIAAVLTLFAAIGNLFAEYQEKLLTPQAGNIYDISQKLAEGSYKCHRLATELGLALKYKQDAAVLTPLIGNSNLLCEQLNGWLIQILSNLSKAK